MGAIPCIQGIRVPNAWVAYRGRSCAAVSDAFRPRTLRRALLWGRHDAQDSVRRMACYVNIGDGNLDPVAEMKKVCADTAMSNDDDIG